VEPTNVHAGRRGVPLLELAPWLDAHDVTAAWTLSPESLREIMAVWPHARLTRIGQGTLVSRE
jgi:hypothetical protein